MTAAEALHALRKAMRLSYDTLCMICSVEYTVIRAACTGNFVSAADWTSIEEGLAAYLTAERIETAGLTVEHVTDLLDQLTCAWQEAAHIEARIEREARAA